MTNPEQLNFWAHFSLTVHLNGDDGYIFNLYCANRYAGCVTLESNATSDHVDAE